MMVLSCCTHGAGRPGSYAYEGKERRLPAELRVGSYNLYVGAKDLPKTMAVIKRMDADVIALQEVKPGYDNGLTDALSAEYPHRYFSSGLGVLSRFPLRAPTYQHSRRGINGFIFAVIEHPRGRVQFADLHLDPLRLWRLRDLAVLPLQFSRQRRIQKEELSQAFAQLRPGLPTVLAGDFNRVSDDVITTLQEGGFVDSFAAVTPHPEAISTLHFSFLGIHFGKRIDFIFHDRSFRTAGSQVVNGAPSDHDALVTDLVRLRGAKP